MSSMSSARMLSRSLAAATSRLSAARRIHSLARPQASGLPRSTDSTHHAVVSTFDLFSIGVGPSSSHTVGPMRAGKIFVQDLVDHKILDKVASIKADLYGSLALTGIGHGTPNATLMGLEGELPETVPTETIIPRVEAMHETHTITLNGTHRIRFNPDKDLTLHYYESLPQHPNGMRFTVFDANGDMLATNEYFSIGGGFVVNEKTQVAHGENVFFRNTESQAETSSHEVDERTQQDLVTAALPFRSGKDLIEMCERENLSIAEVVFLNELQWRSREEVIDSAYRIWGVMDDSIRRGCLSTDRQLPGPPQCPAPAQRNELTGVFKRRQRARRPVLPQLDYLSVYAIAVNEENAAGGRVVTAPTNGAAGVIPAVLKYHLEFLSEDPRGASISAAEMGCQGEVAAAAFAAVMGGTPRQVENAAEIGMEHNLGLTCDPVDGLVQIPCIERNALGAVKAVTAAQLALQGDGHHRVTLDQVIETMRQTGQDMMSKYKETSQGGLAVNVPVC
ncbi:L-serine ammonia-lyase [Linderina pennispora]|uniref:L-serine ammonia-lyase n=1 Tax=Linderina pennispora TaxID=61395 RepID=A0A1Y1WCZ6_9FUNG|nr:L-serine ammonia-lyase [Linderina pennispora]ORX71417.1 L-serine ammonia-lyase [Linderina pennispora]